MPSAWERMCELKAGSDLIRRVSTIHAARWANVALQVNRARDKFVEIDPAATAEEKLLSSSVRAYTSGIASSPQSTDNYYKRGYVQFMHKEYESAIHDFSRAVHWPLHWPHCTELPQIYCMLRSVGSLHTPRSLRGL